MCRLFGLHAGRVAVTATFWLLDAPDSLSAQSRRNPDGTGVGAFDTAGNPVLHKEPMAAWNDIEFASAAMELTGTIFLAHVRYATTGALDVVDTHPFLQEGRLFAHNGVVHGLDILDARLRELNVADLVMGDTDSERVFALITSSIRQRDGDIGAGLKDAVRWVAEYLPLYAVNVVLGTSTDLWALRYPETHPLYVLDRRDPASADPDQFDLQSSRIHARSSHLSEHPSVIIASEPMDEDSDWRLLDPGELVHIDAELNINFELALPNSPAYQLSLADLSPAAARAQHDLGAV